MSAETLREAAALMRERAEAATPGPWVQNGFEYDDESDVFTYDVAATSDPVRSLLYTGDKGDATHIASWHPTVALAVADWLDHEAQIAEEDAADGYEMGPRYPGLTVARAYLGSDQ